MIADLEHLVKIQQASVHNGQILNTTERREEILRMLSNMDTVALSDREIARRVGASPQTVGNLRHRMTQR
jgi:DNA-binding CsgD family transcriptional regulator